MEVFSLYTSKVWYQFSLNDDSSIAWRTNRVHWWGYREVSWTQDSEMGSLNNLGYNNLGLDSTIGIHDGVIQNDWIWSLGPHNSKSILFNKTFRLPHQTDYSTGQILNLIDRDTNQAWSLLWDLSELIKLPFEISLCSYYIFTSIGWSFLSSVAVLLTVSGIIYLNKGYFLQLDKDLNAKKDVRM